MAGESSMNKIVEIIFFGPLVLLGSFALAMAFRFIWIEHGWRGIVGVVLAGAWLISGALVYLHQNDKYWHK